ncbi:nucleotide exchange factor GrpE [Hyphococcus sp. DH-69]|uniref:nucleotide exchange factor GrpE n=1 Tax=Hyphococcus formosus TaxID=3143534 RepID=UPI00398B64BB
MMSDQSDFADQPASKNDQNDETIEQLTDEEIAAAIAADGDSDPLEEARKEIDTLNDRLLRLAAELENTRRRGEREKADAGKYAITNFARDLIGVTDNFERALRAADGSQGEATSESVKSLIDGLRMTEKDLLTALDRHGVRKINPEREKFDPNLHQAVAQVPHTEIPNGHVVDVAQPGFTIGDRVLRAAMVTVSSGPGSAAGEGESNDNSSGPRLDTKV